MAISANTWFTCWLGLEINLISMLPLILIGATRHIVEAAIKYFLIQALASIILIISATLRVSFSSSLKIRTTETLIFLALLLKAGIPPLHYWFPNIINNINWLQCFILFTWQKVAPLLLLSIFKINKIIIIAIISIIVGTVGGLNQVIIKTLLTYSSITHRSWLLISAASSSIICLFYFVIYCILSASIIFIVLKSPVKKINDMAYWKETLIHKYLIIFNLLALGGLPPFLGFLAKLSVIIILIKINVKLLILIFIMISLISLFYYFRVIYSLVLNKHTKKIITINSTSKASFGFLIFVATSNIIIPLINVVL